MNLLHGEITKNIIGAAFEVYNELGYGFLEKVYQRAMQVELIKRGHKAELETLIQVYYKNVCVGDYKSDIWVDNRIIVELKVAPKYNPKDEAQILHLLKATRVKVGLLINFGKEKVEFDRFIYTKH